MIGGWLTESYNWRWVFYINLPIGIPTVALLLWLLPSRPITKRYFDGLGFAALALGVATLQLMLDRGQHEDWFESWEIRIEAIIAVSALWVFFVHQMTTKKPMFEPELVTDRNFVTALGFMIMIGVMMFGIFALMPPMLQTLFGYSVFDTGLLLAPRGIGILKRFAGGFDIVVGPIRAGVGIDQTLDLTDRKRGDARNVIRLHVKGLRRAFRTRRSRRRCLRVQRRYPGKQPCRDHAHT
jgi:DHA2 family multidrug resistance protein